MKVVTRDVPTPKKGEMLIKVAAAAINRPDVIQVRFSRLSLMVRDRACTLQGCFQHSRPGVLWNGRGGDGGLPGLQGGR